MIINTEKLYLGTALAVTRVMLGMTQKELSELLNIPANTISKVEIGLREMPDAYVDIAWDWIVEAKYSGRH